MILAVVVWSPYNTVYGIKQWNQEITSSLLSPMCVISAVLYIVFVDVERTGEVWFAAGSV